MECVEFHFIRFFFVQNKIFFNNDRKTFVVEFYLFVLNGSSLHHVTEQGRFLLEDSKLKINLKKSINNDFSEGFNFLRQLVLVFSARDGSERKIQKR